MIRSKGSARRLTTGRVRLIAAITAAVVMLAGFVVGFRIALDRINSAIPQTDLFGATPGPTGTPTPERSPDGWDIKGPLNILIAGHDMVPEIDFRQIPHSDAVMILHIDETLTHAYLTSLPRDLLVPIPANEASGSSARSRDKLTHSLGYGARVPGTNEQNLAQGFALLARTVSDYTGIEHFDAGALINFGGLATLVDTIGGIDMQVDNPVTSIHRRPDGTSDEGGHGGEWMRYDVGMHHFSGWQALDYARQRYSLPDGAHGRDRHHRQMVRAIVTKLFAYDYLGHPGSINRILDVLGEMLVLDLRGRKVTDYLYALRNLRPDSITLVGLPGGSVFSGGGSYLGEQLYPIQAEYFAALREDGLEEFLAEHHVLVNQFIEPDIPRPM